MLNSSDSAGLARPLRKILLATVVSFALVGFGSGVASAQEDPTTPSSDTSTPTSSESSTPPSSSASEEAPPAPPEENKEQPGQDNEDPPAEEPKAEPPDVTAVGKCAPGRGVVIVTIENPNKEEVVYEVSLFKAGSDDPLQTKSVPVAAEAADEVEFDDLPMGDFEVAVEGNDGTQASSSTAVDDRCHEIGPIDDALQVFVRCQDGEGLVTIRVFGQAEELRTYTISTELLEEDEEVQLDKNIYLVIDELPAADGTYIIKVVEKLEEGAEKVTTETVTVACAPKPTTPAPQPRPAPSDGDGLASTGAAVGGMALLGVVALGLGGGLVVASRRRKNAQPEETEA